MTAEEMIAKQIEDERIAELVEKHVKILMAEGWNGGSDGLEDRLYTLYDDLLDSEKSPRIAEQVSKMVGERIRAATPQNKTNTTRQCDKKNFKAPYRFVALNETVVHAGKPETTPLDRPIPEGYCATIDVAWVAETPLLIGEPRTAENGVETVGPLRLGEQHVVPGASLRGMIRAAMEHLAFARLHPINGHHRYGLRDFDHPDYKDGSDVRYPVSDIDALQAGWLSFRPAEPGKESGVYELMPCKKEWSLIEVNDLPDGLGVNGWKGKSLSEKYAAARIRKGKLFDFTKILRFEIAGDVNGKRVLRPNPQGNIEGVLVFSGPIPGGGNKKREYVLHEPEKGTKPVPLSGEAVEQFERLHSKPSKNKPEPDGSWKFLKPTVTAGNRIPVFYVGDPSENDPQAPFAFGLTRLFKVPHRHSVAEVAAHSGEVAGRPTARREKGAAEVGEADFVENLFGYVLEGDEFDFEDASGDRPNALARKGRAAFSFGRFEDKKNLRETELIETVMMGPRASFAPFYLRGDFKDYGDGKVQLSGRKRYIPRYPHDRLKDAPTEIKGRLQGQIPTQGAVARNKSIRTGLLFLEPKVGELRFASSIRLHNVTAEEIGALLWTLTHGGAHDKPYRHMLGRAKAFGAGQLRVDTARLSLRPNGPAAPENNAGHDPFLEAFEAMMENQAPGWRKSPTVKEFLGCCRPDKGAKLESDGRLEYLRDPKDFAAIRKQTQRLADNSPPCFPNLFGGRFLETPEDESPKDD